MESRRFSRNLRYSSRVSGSAPLSGSLAEGWRTFKLSDKSTMGALFAATVAAGDADDAGLVAGSEGARATGSKGGGGGGDVLRRWDRDWEGRAGTASSAEA